MTAPEDDLRGSGRAAGYRIALIFAMVMHVFVGALTFLGGKLAYLWLPLWFVGLVTISRLRTRGAIVLVVPWVVVGIMFATAYLFGEWAGIRTS